MAFQSRERHEVGSYVFHWFSDGGGEWVVAIWSPTSEPDRPTEADFENALTVHRVSTRENPKGSLKPVRDFCERFIADIPFRVRAIRNKIPTLRAMKQAETDSILPS